jgi:hypothetical protein
MRVTPQPSTFNRSSCGRDRVAGAGNVPREVFATTDVREQYEKQAQPMVKLWRGWFS